MGGCVCRCRAAAACRVVVAYPCRGVQVLLVNVVGTVVLSFWAGGRVGGARVKFKVPFGQMYSTKHDLFNYYQRGHQHILEHMTLFLSMSLIGGLKWPVG